MLDRAIEAATRGGRRTLFISHAAAPEVAKLVDAGSVVFIFAQPIWWKQKFYALTNYQVLPADVTKEAGLRWRGVPILPLECYTNDPDWPVILEAIIRLQLIDISAVFG